MFKVLVLYKLYSLKLFSKTHYLRSQGDGSVNMVLDM